MKFKNQAGPAPELLLYGEIGDWWADIEPTSFARTLKSITADTIKVRINSPGGSVFAAQAIYSSLKSHPAKIEVHIDGLAASAATIIAMAGDEIIMPKNTMMMIHSPWIGIAGNSEELRDMADTLDKITQTLVAVYQQKSGLDESKIMELLASDTWLTADEALALGLVDAVSKELPIAASISQNGKFLVNGNAFNAHQIPKEWHNKIEEKKEAVAKMTPEELKEAYPEVYDQILAQGAAQGAEAERERIKSIEDMAIAGHELLAQKAKFEAAMQPSDFAMQIVKAEKQAKQQYLASREQDAQAAAEAAHSDPLPAETGESKQVKEAQTVNLLASKLKKALKGA